MAIIIRRRELSLWIRTVLIIAVLFCVACKHTETAKTDAPSKTSSPTKAFLDAARIAMDREVQCNNRAGDSDSDFQACLQQAKNALDNAVRLSKNEQDLAVQGLLGIYLEGATTQHQLMMMEATHSVRSKSEVKLWQEAKSKNVDNMQSSLKKLQEIFQTNPT